MLYQQEDNVLREQLGSELALMNSAPKVVKLAQYLASEASKKVSSNIVASEVVLEADTTGVNARTKKGYMDEDLDDDDQAIVSQSIYLINYPLSNPIKHLCNFTMLTLQNN